MKGRLSLLYFLQFSVWGCYLTCFGQLLGTGGLGMDIAWFYAAIGIVSIISPPLFGRLSDKTGQSVRILGFCHLGACGIMLCMWGYAITHEVLSFKVFYTLYLLFLLLYMPTMALANTSAFKILDNKNIDTVTTFPLIRIWGTVGFVAAMWFVNSAYWSNGTFGFTLSEATAEGRLRFQYNAMQLLCSGAAGFLTSIYVFTALPLQKQKEQHRKTPSPGVGKSLLTATRAMLCNPKICIFLIFVALTGVCLQISNGFAIPYITHFTGIQEYADSLVSGNATLLFSLSQISEAICILLVGITLKRKGIIFVYAAGMLAWALRFLLLGAGNPSDGLWMLVGSMLIYGIAFNFITIGGHLHIQKVADATNKGFAQGLMMFMSNGIGATTGILLAGQIVNHWCSWQMVRLPGSDSMTRLFMGEWSWPWLIFGCYAFVVMIAWLLLSRYIRKCKNNDNEEPLQGQRS